MKEIKIEDLIDKTWFGILVNKFDTMKYGIRIRPWVKIKAKEGKLNLLRFKLKSEGISSSIVDEYIYIPITSSCLLILKYVEPPDWWRKALEMIKDGRHRTKRGIMKIVERRNKEAETVSNERITVDEVARIISENQ